MVYGALKKVRWRSRWADKQSLFWHKFKVLLSNKGSLGSQDDCVILCVIVWGNFSYLKLSVCVCPCIYTYITYIYIHSLWGISKVGKVHSVRFGKVFIHVCPFSTLHFLFLCLCVLVLFHQMDLYTHIHTHTVTHTHTHEHTHANTHTQPLIPHRQG